MHNQNLGDSPYFHDNSMHDNQVAWIANGSRNDYWLGTDTAEFNNTSFSTVDEAAEWTFWQNKLTTNGIQLGPS
jgi:hypothetical protein